MRRLELFRNQLRQKTPFLPQNPIEPHLNKEELNYLYKFRDYLKKEVTLDKLDYLTQNEITPLEICKDIAKNFPAAVYGNVGKGILNPISPILDKAIVVELCKLDLGFLGLLIVHGRLVMGLIDSFCDLTTKKELLPKMATFEVIGSFCLTEKVIGSEAHNLNTSFTKTKGGYILNGDKRWIGNADQAKCLIVFAKDNSNGSINALIVDPTTKENRETVKITKINGKIPSRMVHNCDIEFNNVFVPEENRIKSISSFQDVSINLIGSRLAICYMLLGMAQSAYDETLRFCTERKQFNKPIISFQLMQSKLVQIAGKVEAITNFILRLQKVCDENGMNQGKVGLAKAWCSHTTRDCLLLAREAMGGNGILSDNIVMKHLIDVESMITVEGTYDINILAAGKDLTGISSYYTS